MDMDSTCAFTQNIIKSSKGFGDVTGDRSCTVDFNLPSDTYPDGTVCFPVSCNNYFVVSADKSTITGTSNGDYCIFNDNNDVRINENGSIDEGTKKFEDAKGVFEIHAARKDAVPISGIVIELRVFIPQ